MATASTRSFIPVKIAVLTVSNTRTLEDDTSGQTIADRAADAGHALSARKMVKDDIRAIRHVIRDWTNRDDIDVIITTGGTGLTGFDVTIEACRALFEGNRRLRHIVPDDFLQERWNIGDPVARHCRHHERQVYLLPAGLTWRLPRWLG